MRNKNYHLREPDGRSKYYRYNRDVPADVRDLVGKSVATFSLRVTSAVEARKQRDQWDDYYEAEWANLRQQKLLNSEARLIKEAADLAAHLRKPRQPVSPPKGPHASLLIPKGPFKPKEAFDQPELKKLVEKLNKLVDDRLTGREKDDPEKREQAVSTLMTENDIGRQLRAYTQKVTGRKSYKDFGEEFLAHGRRRKDNLPLAETTKVEFRRAYKHGDTYNLPQPENVTWDIAKSFLQKVADEEGFSKQSINNVRTAFSSLWKSMRLNTVVWMNHEVDTSKPAIPRTAWLDNELRQLIDGARDSWLQDVIWIALYTGHRQEAIAHMGYEPSNDFIYFKKLKTEKADRFHPCHPDIREAVKRWVQRPRAKSTIGNEFTELKTRLGFATASGEELKDFHSLRGNLTDQLSHLQVNEDMVNTIVGRRNTSVTFGNYGYKSLPPTAVAEINRLRPHIEKIDWKYLYKGELPPPMKSGKRKTVRKQRR